MALIINPYLSHIKLLEDYAFDHKSIYLSYYINWKPMALIINPYLSHIKLSGSLWL